MSITETQPNSPVRSGTGRIRNLGAMGEAKLTDLAGPVGTLQRDRPGRLGGSQHGARRHNGHDDTRTRRSP